MKKINISLILSLALLISFVLVGALINKVIAVTTNDVFYFSMETAANHNEITQENEGTIIGTPQLIQRDTGKAMSLNGSSGLTLDTIDLSGDFTLELDFMRESVPSDYETLISKCDYGTSREWWLGVARVSSSQMSIKLNIRNSNTTQWNGIGANITIGEYHSVKIVASERIVWLYVDNICKGSMDFVRDNTNTPICIGHTLRNGSSLQYFKGVIDEIKLSMSNNNKDSLAEKLNNNQILRYSFENSTTNTITDTSGNNHNATLSTNLIDISETSSKITNGINDYGMYFNGSQMITTDYILNPKRNLTVSVYFKVNEFTSTEQIIFGQANYANGIRDFTVYVTKGKLLKINIKKATQSTSDGWITATVSEIEANKWYNLTFTIENDILTSYINGFESKKLNISNLSYSGETPITIGGLYSGNNITQPFKGYVDDFVIYSKVLSSDEIFESLSNNLTNKQKRDVVEISGDTLYDNLEMLDQTQFISISKSDLNAYKWQHGGAIAYYKNKFYATWGRNIGEENTVGEEAACFVSEDGINWTYNASFIAETGYGYSHGSIFEVNGKLYSMYPHYSGSTYGTVGSSIKFNNLENSHCFLFRGQVQMTFYFNGFCLHPNLFEEKNKSDLR